MTASGLITRASGPGAPGFATKGFIILLSLITCLISGLKALSTSQGVCIQVVYGNYYQLTELESTQDMVIDVGNTAGRIIFNMCRFIESRCPGYNNSFAIYRDENLCIPLTTDSITQHLNRSLMPLRPNTDNETAGLNLTFVGPYRVDASKPLTTTNFSLQLLLDCDKNETDKAFNWSVQQPMVYMDNGTAVIYGRGSQACPVYSGAFLLDFFHRFFYYIAALAIVIGLVECFYGVRLFKFTMFVMGFLVGFIIMAIFLYIIWNVPDAPAYKGYVIVAFAVLTGLMFGFLVASIAWVGLVLAGSLLGFFAALLIFSSFLSNVVSLPPNLVLYNTVAVGMVVGSLLGFELQNEILNISCSFSGAYLAVRGVSFYVGGFPAEITATGLTSDDSTTTEEASSSLRWVYYGAIIALTAAGIFVQQRQIRSDLEAKSAMEARKKELDAQVFGRPDMREMAALGEPLVGPEDREADDYSPPKEHKKTPSRPIPPQQVDSEDEETPKPAKKVFSNKKAESEAKPVPKPEGELTSTPRAKLDRDKKPKKVPAKLSDEADPPVKSRRPAKATDDSDDDSAHKPAEPEIKNPKRPVAAQAAPSQEESEEIEPADVEEQPKKGKDPKEKDYKSGVSKLFSSIEPKNEEDFDQERSKPPQKPKTPPPSEANSKPPTAATTSTLLSKVATNMKKAGAEAWKPAAKSPNPPPPRTMETDEEQDTSTPVEEPQPVVVPTKERKHKPVDKEDAKDVKPPKHKKAREQPPAVVEAQPEELVEAPVTHPEEEEEEQPKKAGKEKKDKKDKKDKKEKREKRESEPQEISEPPLPVEEEPAEEAPKAKKKKRKKDREDPEEEG